MIIIGTKAGTVLGIDLISQSESDVWSVLESASGALKLIGETGFQIGIVDGREIEYVVSMDPADLGDHSVFLVVEANIGAY